MARSASHLTTSLHSGPNKKAQSSGMAPSAARPLSVSTRGTSVLQLTTGLSSTSHSLFASRRALDTLERSLRVFVEHYDGHLPHRSLDRPPQAPAPGLAS